jgi:nucleoid-associated protein EbfC
MMKGGLGGLMKQAQQMQANMKKAQDELATVEVEGQAGSGMVRVTMTCAHEVRRIKLDAGVKQVAATTKAKMGGFGAGLNLPPGMSLPF